MKSVIKRFIFCILLQSLFALSLFGQKYENGTRLLKGAEVLSATPLQLDYVLEKLADTTKIDVNIHEGKTHLVLDDGSGVWREWWYYMGRWQVKTKDGALPSGKESSIQTKSGKTFAGTNLGINEGFIYGLDETPSDVGITNKNATVRVTPQSQAVVEASKTDGKGVTTSNVFVTPVDVSVINQKYDKGALLKADTSNLTHWRTKQTGNDYWNIISSLADTTFYVKKRMKFDQPNTSVYVKNGDLRLSDKTGDYALSDLADDTDGTVTSVGLSMPSSVFSVADSPVTSDGTISVSLKSQPKSTVLAAPISAQGVPVFRQIFLQDLPSITWSFITSKPTTISGFGITDAYTATQTRAVIGDTATVLRNLIKNKTVTESDPTVPTHVKSITTANVTNWNTAYTNSHTHGNKTVLDGITAANVTNWTNAFNWGNHATQGYLKAESDPVWTAAQGNYYTKTNLQTSGGAQVHWNNITNKPTTAGGYGITDVYTKTETRVVVGDTATVLRNLIKNKTVTESDPTVPTHVKSITTANVTNWNTAYTNSHTHSNKTVLDGITAANVTNWNTAFGWGNHATQGYLKAESDPVWNAEKTNYYTKTNLQTSGGAAVHWDNISNKPAMGTGSVTSVGLSLPSIFSVTGTPVTASGTLSATLASQTKNMVFAAPTSANGTPTFRALQETDIPNINWTKIYNTPPTLAEHGITNAYTKTETNALLDIAGNNYQLLMLYNKRPAVIPRTTVSNQPTHTQIIFGGYEKTWEYPDIRIPASIMADATGFNFSGSWLNYRTAIETRSGNISFNVSDLDDNNFQSSFRMTHYGISQNATNIYWDTKQGYNLMVRDGDNRNDLWTTLTQTKNEIRKKAGNYIYHTNFQIGDGSLWLSSGIEENNIVRPTGSFYVAQKYMNFDRFYSYSAYDTTMRVLNAIDLYSYDEPKAGHINVTDNNDIRFESKASTEQTETGSITLTEIIQKGQIFKQSAEPTIPDESFAFWVNGSNFYIVLRSNNIQKKIQLQ